MARNGKISLKQEAALVALIAKSSISEAAKSAKIGQRTLWRWLQSEDFKKAYLSARRQVVVQAVAKVQSGMTAAAETLIEVMKDEKSSSSARVSAARTMLDMGIKAIEIEEIELRVEALENIIKEKIL